MAVYAVDFDNTLAVTRFPQIVAPNYKMIAFVKAVKAQGHKVILWTSRSGENLESAVEWCKKQGIIFDAVNAPLPEQLQYWSEDTRKIYADYYLDDKNLTIDQAEHCVAQLECITAELNAVLHDGDAAENAEDQKRQRSNGYMNLERSKALLITLIEAIQNDYNTDITHLDADAVNYLLVLGFTEEELVELGVAETAIDHANEVNLSNDQPTYKITIEEQASQAFNIRADTMEAAVEKARNMYKEGELILEDAQLSEALIMAESADGTEVTSWFKL